MNMFFFIGVGVFIFCYFVIEICQTITVIKVVSYC